MLPGEPLLPGSLYGILAGLFLTVLLTARIRGEETMHNLLFFQDPPISTCPWQFTFRNLPERGPQANSIPFGKLKKIF